jgi:hypothetical protein
VLDATLTKSGARRRSSAFVKLKEIASTVVTLRRLTVGQNNAGPSAVEQQDFTVKRERGNLANLVMATGLGRKNVQETRRGKLQGFDDAAKRGIVSSMHTPQPTAMVTPPAVHTRLQDLDFQAFSEPESFEGVEPDEDAENLDAAESIQEPVLCESEVFDRPRTVSLEQLAATLPSTATAPEPEPCAATGTSALKSDNKEKKSALHARFAIDSAVRKNDNPAAQPAAATEEWVLTASDFR